MLNIVSKAADFAFKAHHGQTRKFTGEPYICHPARVAMAVSMHYIATDELIAAAWLHDVVEDCNVKPEELFSEFGLRVYNIVLQLTNPPKDMSLSRAERKYIDRQHLAAASPEAMIIKMYDRLDNLRDLASCPTDFPLKYSRETLLLLEVIGHVDREIEQLILREVQKLTEVK